MKKTLVAMAVMAAAGAASAQSSVTMFGIVDVTVQYGTGDSNRLSIQPNGHSASRLGIRGVEDLGGGLSANFWLEAGIEPDTGVGQPSNVNNQANPTPLTAGLQGIMFNRRSTIGLAGGFGEIRLGRDYMGHFWAHTAYDPMGANGVGASLAFVNHIAAWPTATRASNSIHYLLPANIGGFYGQVGYHLGDNLRNGAATEDDGNGYSARLGYAAGPFDVSAAFGRADYASTATTGDVTTWNVGGSWNFGVAKASAMYSRTEIDSLAATATRELNSWVAGVNVPVGTGEIRAAYSQSEFTLGTGAEPRSRKVALGYVHNLSKRTAVYTSVAHLRNNGGASAALGRATVSANGKSSGVDIGVRHAF
ncbi:porin [Ramlibacter sp. AW1]|uniref:Porin n=1 Tax=Ramlibacter aurantiacus TaxID=2801330 RepID=A0A937D3J9_9BURK|nr:porin [Ramlibacter aurantiacus]MBL0422749.1 porin [Ramlibacter aurantiacus]